MSETRVRRDGSILVPEDLLDAVKLSPGSKVRLRVKQGVLVVEKVKMAEDPFAAAARGPDQDAMDKIRKRQEEEKEAAKARFEELMKKPPKVRPEDNLDLWR